MNKIRTYIYNKVLNNKGVTLFEMLISIVVGSILLMMLMQILTMTITAKSRNEINNELLNQSYFLTDKIQQNVFDLQVQEIEVVQDDINAVEIHFKHLRDIVVNSQVLEDPDLVTPIVDILIYNKLTGQITYNGTLLHSSDVNILSGTNIEAISIDGTCDFTTIVCEQGIIKITLEMSLSFDNNDVKTKTYITTIIV